MKGGPRGTVVSIANVETYVVKPPNGKENGNILALLSRCLGTL